MKNGFWNVISLLAVALVIALVFSLGFIVMVGIVYAMSWLLRWFFPLGLFESLVVSALLTWMTALVANAIIGFFFNPNSMRTPFSSFAAEPKWKDLELNDPELTKISRTRLYKSDNERTWEAWLTYEIANDIYADFQIDPQTVAAMNDSQRQELAIRLAELGVAILKRKTSASRNFQVNANAVRRELERIGQKPYDSDLITVAVDAINVNVDYYGDELASVIRNRLWQQLATVVED